MPKTILIVDDEVEIVEELMDILSDEGYDILAAHNGVDAVDVVKNNRVSLILLDIKLPKMGGVETFKIIRKMNSKIPIIVITGSFTREKAEEILREGGKEVLYKPFSAEKLISIIKKYA